MLIERFCTPTSTRKCTPTQQQQQQQQSQQMINEYTRDFNSKSRHQRRPLISLHHQHWQQQQHQHHSHLQRHQRCILLLIVLILMQQIEVHTCCLLPPHRNSKSLSLANEGDELDEQALSSSSAVETMQSHSDSSMMSKRGEHVYGQPEEIFTVDNQVESNYDEYPMIVPKRAALLLDRLMVSLHRALEKERNQQRQIGELNKSRKNGDEKSRTEVQVSNNDGTESKSGIPQFESMYGDDPTVLMDYDFKDLNSINRVTGETLMGTSFQRRANIGSTEGIALLASALTQGIGNSLISGASGASSGGSGGSNIGVGGRANTGRMYWRCYFNAVSCF